jgi:hypothetical protein
MHPCSIKKGEQKSHLFQWQKSAVEFITFKSHQKGPNKEIQEGQFLSGRCVFWVHSALRYKNK